jgi:cyclophilin family peptidyl-prolyl cis-trans isomerase
MKREGVSAVIAVVIAAVVIAAGALAAFFVLDMLESDAGESPNEALETFINELNSGDANGVVDTTLAVFSDQYGASVQMVQSDLFDREDGLLFVLNGLDIIFYNDEVITSDQQAGLDALVWDVQTALDADVQDSCLLLFNMTASNGLESATFTGEIEAVEIGDEWYLAIYFINEFTTGQPIPKVPFDPTGYAGDGKTIVIELKEADAPNTCENFMKYVEDGFYDGTIFHRVIDGFVIQGGGHLPDMTMKAPTYPPIDLEISQNITHTDGAVAMARTNDPNSATSQFYICDGAQHNLDGMYAVFGYVVTGMDVIRAITALPTTMDGGHSDVPVNDVIITSCTLYTNADGRSYVVFEVNF